MADNALFDFNNLELDRSGERQTDEHADNQTIFSGNMNILSEGHGVQILNFQP